MAPGERDYPINAKISSEAAQRLKQISVKRHLSYGEILDGLIMGVPLPTADWEKPLQDALSRIELLEAQVSALLSGSMPIANTETLPAVAGVAPSALESDLSASDDQEIDELGPTEITAEIASESEIEALPEDHQKPSLSTPSNESLEPAPTGKDLPVMDHAVLELVRKGMGQTDIANELNRRGYRAVSGAPITKGHSTIAKIIKQVRGKKP